MRRPRLLPRAALRGRAGFTLLEIMAALLLLAVIFTTVLQIRAESVERVANARWRTIAARLGTQLMHRMEAAMLHDVYDGAQGDFSEEGYGDFTWVIGVGDGSRYTGDVEDETEEIWRRFRERLADDEEDDPENKPAETRIFLTVTHPTYDGEGGEVTLETLVPTWAVEQDFELYEATWPDNEPTKIE